MSIFGSTLSGNLANTTRKFDITYTNNSNKYILVFIYGYHRNNWGSVYFNDIRVLKINGYGTNPGVFFVVPPKYRYKVDSKAMNLEGWYEIS